MVKKVKKNKISKSKNISQKNNFKKIENKKSKVWIILSVVILILLLGVLIFYLYESNKNSVSGKVITGNVILNSCINPTSTTPLCSAYKSCSCPPGCTLNCFTSSNPNYNYCNLGKGSGVISCSVVNNEVECGAYGCKWCKAETCNGVDDDCDGVVDNGATCSTGQTCTNGACVANCIPKTCAQLGYTCGIVSNGCVGSLGCGTCSTGACLNHVCNSNIANSGTCSGTVADCSKFLVSNSCPQGCFVPYGGSLSCTNSDLGPGRSGLTSLSVNCSYYNNNQGGCNLYGCTWTPKQITPLCSNLIGTAYANCICQSFSSGTTAYINCMNTNSCYGDSTCAKNKCSTKTGSEYATCYCGAFNSTYSESAFMTCVNANVPKTPTPTLACSNLSNGVSFVNSTGSYTFSNDCINTNTVKNYFCSSSTSYTFTNKYCTLPNTCSSGICQCISNWTTIVNNCNPDETGTITYYDLNGCQSNYTNSNGYCDYNGNGIIGTPENISKTNFNKIFDVTIYGDVFNKTENYTDLSQQNGPLDIQFSLPTTGDTIVSISSFDFTENVLSFPSISIKRESSSDDFGYTLVSGLEGIDKIIYVDRVDNSSQVCIKDGSVSSVNSFSDSCDSTNEYLLDCPGTDRAGYSCEISSDGYYDVVSGLTNSGVEEYAGSNNNNNNNPGCTPNINCGSFGSCAGGIKIQTCVDTNMCNPSNSTYQNTQACSLNNNFVCNNGDTQDCGTAGTQTCSNNNWGTCVESKTPSSNGISTGWIILIILVIILLGVLLYLFLNKNKKNSDGTQTHAYVQQQPPRAPPQQPQFQSRPIYPPQNYPSR